MDAPFVVAARVLRCPASVFAKVPENLHRSSAYAARGTALHAAMAHLIDKNEQCLDRLIGRTFNDYTITSDDVENALRTHEDMRQAGALVATCYSVDDAPQLEAWGLLRGDAR
jgi:hypothetical protein